jgi:DNA mismatch repair ATPase MutS
MKGPATSQNAVKLLELAGFPGEIIAEASCPYS